MRYAPYSPLKVIMVHVQCSHFFVIRMICVQQSAPLLNGVCAILSVNFALDWCMPTVEITFESCADPVDPLPPGKCWTPSGSLGTYSFLCDKTIGSPLTVLNKRCPGCFLAVGPRPPPPGQNSWIRGCGWSMKPNHDSNTFFTWYYSKTLQKFIKCVCVGNLKIRIQSTCLACEFSSVIWNSEGEFLCGDVLFVCVYVSVSVSFGIIFES